MASVRREKAGLLLSPQNSQQARFGWPVQFSKHLGGESGQEAGRRGVTEIRVHTSCMELRTVPYNQRSSNAQLRRSLPYSLRLWP